MNKSTSWGNVASWYDDTVNNPDSYQSKVILPNLLRLAAPKPGEKILDLACGQGYFSHALSAEGSYVTGIDISPELIDIAKKHAVHNQEFYVLPAHDLSKFKNESYDTVVCVLAIQNIERMTDVFREVSRIIKPRGKFILVLNHPAFRIPGKSSWGFDEKAGIQYRRVDEYISESKSSIDMHPGREKKELTYSFHRPLQAYSKSLSNNKFAILRIEEWMSHKQSEQGPKKPMEDRARKEIPLFMCIDCTKL
jgi:ubiquinone/menaquinone biosynthesis C-methylase UbiE